MAFCKKCGAIIPFEGGKCSRCGSQTGAGGAGFGAGTGFGAGAGFEKEGLIKKLERYKQLLAECEELKGMIKPQSSFPSSAGTDFKPRSFMKYFWPFLVGGVVGGYLVYLASTLIVSYSIATNPYITSNNMDAYASNALGDIFAGLIAAVIVAGIIIFFGYKIAKRKQTDFNSNAEFMNREATERYNKGVQNQKMIDVYQENINEMRQYELLVPEAYRTSAQVESIIELLREEKAETVEEACALL